MIIIGIDPGYAIVGIGVVEYVGNKFRTLEYNAITTPAGMPTVERLKKIYTEMTMYIDKYKPDAVAIEELFFNSNQKTAINVAQARGVLLVAVANKNVPISEYTPLQVKQSVTGYGRADKKQIQSMVKMILGLTPITSGKVDVFGQDIKGREKQVFPRIGAIIETPGFYPNLTGTENLEIFAKLRGTVGPNAVKKALEVVGLPYKDKKLFSKYSLGMKQRLGIANAILHDPELLILDEPTNGLDPIGIAEMRNFIKELSVERGKTILISSHILSEIALLADDIGIIDHGLLLEENSMKELKKKNRKYILLQVSDVSKAALILEHQFHLVDYSVHDDQTLRIYDTCLDMAEINKALIVQDIAVISSQVCNDTLEDYFKKITGGEGIA